LINNSRQIIFERRYMSSEYIDSATGEVVQLGIVEMTNDKYHAAPGVSKSHLDYVADNGLRKYWHRYLAPEGQRIIDKETPAKVLGSAIHCAVLQPDLLRQMYVANPGIDRRSNAGKAEYAAFEAENKGKTILSDDDFQTALAIRDAVLRDDVARGLLAGCDTEQPVFAIDPETGELVKCQLDAVNWGSALVVDVKSTDDASERGFGKSAHNYRYDWQCGWYHDVLVTAFGEPFKAWVFLAVEKTYPYEIVPYMAQPHQIERGRVQAREQFMRIARARQTGHWPGHGGNGVMMLEMPEWRR
jgi:exodeoxyribonuclease VIII